MIRIELLPASFGDCILLEYGSARLVHRVLIDAGLGKTYAQALEPRLRAIAEEQGGPVALELLVVTHIDRDHICGVLPLLREDPPLVAPKDVWFNGRKHLEEDELGAKDGEALEALLVKRKLPWNTAFGARGKHAVVVPDEGPLPEVELAGGAVLTLLSPYRANLAALAGEWDDSLGHWDEPPAAAPGSTEVDDVLGKRPPLKSLDLDTIRELADARFSEDTARPNGSSIAFLFEHGGKRVLFGADAHPTPVLRSLERLSGEPIALDALKLSHHGSMNNTSPALLEKLRCPRFLVSSDGGTFGHPHPEMLARIVTSSPRTKALCFNYASAYTTVWDDESARKQFKYSVAYPDEDAAGYVLVL